MDDVASSVTYWSWQPADLPDGVYDNPHFGQLVPGRIVEVTPGRRPLVDGPEWKKSSRAKFEAQLPITEEIAIRREPISVDEEEE